mmetsp:Transcript_26465/g.43316  ORF Transcript_26465/g.43316 Transcript_26465/m.43316 type:complete len:782 (-) Transcript_26465:666-3011(-)
MVRECQYCGPGYDIEVDHTRGDVVCTNCGSVLEENTIVSEVTFSESAGGASAVVGQFVSGTGTKAAIRGPGGHLQRQSREVTIENGKRKIQQVAAGLRLNAHHVDAAQRLYMLAVQHNFTMGRRVQNVAAACLYVVCRREKTPHLLIDFSDVLQTNLFVLGSCFLKFCRLLNVTLPVLDPSLYIHRFASKLEFEDKTHAVAMSALRLVSRMRRDWIQTGRRPAGICGAAIIIAARMHGFKRDIGEVVQIVRITDITIKKRLCEFEMTPAGELTTEEFEAEIEEEAWSQCDPPAFTRNRMKEEKQAAGAEETREGEEEEEEMEECIAKTKTKKGPKKGKRKARQEDVEEAEEEEESQAVEKGKRMKGAKSKKPLAKGRGKRKKAKGSEETEEPENETQDGGFTGPTFAEQTNGDRHSAMGPGRPEDIVGPNANAESTSTSTFVGFDDVQETLGGQSGTQYDQAAELIGNVDGSNEQGHSGDISRVGSQAEAAHLLDEVAETLATDEFQELERDIEREAREAAKERPSPWLEAILTNRPLLTAPPTVPVLTANPPPSALPSLDTSATCPNTTDEQQGPAADDGAAGAEQEEKRGEGAQGGDGDGLSDFEDDAEVEGCLLTEDEVKTKSALWHELNKEWLTAMEEKKRREEEGGETPRKTPVRRKRKASMGSDFAGAETPLNAAIMALKKQKMSSKINYSVLNNLFDSVASTAASGAVAGATAADMQEAGQEEEQGDGDGDAEDDQAQGETGAGYEEPEDTFRVDNAQSQYGYQEQNDYDDDYY